MADVNSTEDRDQEEPRKGWRERLGGWVRSALRVTGTVVGEAAKSRTATYVGVAMMAAGAMMSLTGVGAVAGGPLMIAGAAIAAGSVALRVRDGASRGLAAAAASDKAPDRQPVQDFSSRSEQSRTPGERHAPGPPGPATDMDLATHLAQATAALAQVVAALAVARQQEQQQPTTARQEPVQDNQNRWDRSSSPSPEPLTARPAVNASLHSPQTARASHQGRGANIPMPTTMRNFSHPGSSSSSSATRPARPNAPQTRGRGQAGGM